MPESSKNTLSNALFEDALEEITVRVTDLSRGGAGVARESNGRVLFIPYSAPGDLVRVRLKDVTKRYAEAEIIEILEASPKRQSPRCPVFGKCGGCQWQHLPYEIQWETKVKGVLHALQRVHISSPNHLDQLPAKQIWEYRNRVQLRGFENHLGFYRAASRELIPIERCDITRPEINASLEQTRSEALKFNRPFKVEIEVLPTGQVRKSWNAPHSAAGFRQVHDEQNELLKDWIFQNLQGSEVLFDLFGGSGNFSVPLASKMREIHCVDTTAPAKNFPNKPAHLHFHRAAVMPWLIKQASTVQKNSHLKNSAILDPPREGLGNQFHEIAIALENLGAKELIAVGCDPDSWARDLSRWIKRGWKLEKVLVLDLFPQTPHVESVGLLTLVC